MSPTLLSASFEATPEAWRIYRQQMLYFLRFLPLGVVIASVPVGFRVAGRNAADWHTGLGISLIYGFVVPLMVWLAYGVFFALRLKLGPRATWVLQYSWLTNLLVNLLGFAVGLALSIALIQRLFHVTHTHLNLLFSILFGGVVMLFFVLYFAYRQANEEALALRASVAEAKYHALENQMRPHFLFNALNSLAELIEAGEGQAAATTYRLAELYRKILANAGTKTASLQSELDVVRAYLEIEKLRLGERLRYEISVPTPLPEIYLPSLMLQTLVENALKHGLAPAANGGELRVEIVHVAAHRWLAQVCNTGKALSCVARSQPNAGAGLANTRARLQLLYGDSYSFNLDTDEAGRTCACFFFTGVRLD